jgi:drug/metabolite transporter (DMT)-like permease
VAVAVGLLLLAAFLAWVAGPRVGHHLMSAGVSAVALGLAPVAMAPLALACNRHR